MRPDEGGGSSNYSSIQFSGMAGLISQVRAAGTTLQDTTRGLQSTASGCGVSSPAFAQIIEIGSWAEEQVAGLQRRLTLAKGAAALVDPGLSGWTIDEPVDMTEGEAGAKGAALAQKILDHNRTDSDFVKLTDDALDELKLYQNDPDVLSGFYAKLGPQMTQLMPSLLEGSGAQDTEQMEKLSETFALAFNDDHPPQGFTDVTELFKTSTGHEPDPTNWDRLAMLQWGHFPPDFVSDVVRANGLEKFADGDGDDVDWRGRMNGALGLDGDVRTLIFGALKNNPEGTRAAFSGLDLDHVVDATYAEGSFDFDLQENFIAAMKAGAGADDETMGDHSYAASRFAFDFIRASASNEDVPDVWVTKEGLAAIAASYAPEFVAGSNVTDDPSRSSTFTKPANFDVPVGLDPAFYLNPQDIYRYLHGFGDLDERFDPPHDYAAPFDDAVGRLYGDSLQQAAKEMKDGASTEPWQDSIASFGNLAGLEYQAQSDVRGGQDESDKKMRELLGGLFTKGIGFVPTPQGIVVKGGVMIAKYAAGKAIKAWVKGDPEATRKALLEDSETQASFLKDYQLMNALNEADFPDTEKLPAALKDGDGHLLAPDKIAKDADLIDAYQSWVDANDRPDDDEDLDTLTERGSDVLLGASTKAENYAKGDKDNRDDYPGYGWDD